MTFRKKYMPPIAMLLMVLSSSAVNAIVSPQEKKVMHALRMQIIGPQLETLVTVTKGFVHKTETSCVNSTKVLDDRQQLLHDFIALKSEWKKSYLLTFGPLMTGDFSRQTDFRPVRRASVEKTLNASELKNTVPDFTEASVSVKGLPVIELLLAEPGSPMAHQSYCNYLLALGQDLLRNARGMLSLLQAHNEDYDRGIFQKAPIRDLMLNHIIHQFNDIENRYIARPFGFKYSTLRRKDLLSSGFSESSRQDLIASLEMLNKIFFCGNPRSSCQSILSLLPDSTKGLKSRLETAVAQLGILLNQSPAFESVIESDDLSPVRAVYDGIQRLNRLMSADLISSLGVTLTFSDNDGD